MNIRRWAELASLATIWRNLSELHSKNVNTIAPIPQDAKVLNTSRQVAKEAPQDSTNRETVTSITAPILEVARLTNGRCTSGNKEDKFHVESGERPT